jgi:hypothetical protein
MSPTVTVHGEVMFPTFPEGLVAEAVKVLTPTEKITLGKTATPT